MCFHLEHLEKFLDTAAPGEWAGESLATVAARHSVALPACKFPAIVHDREALLKAASESEEDVPSLWLLYAILGWGRLRPRAYTWVKPRQVESAEIIKKIRRGEFTRTEAFAKFRALKGSFGMGPAYYTKLIFFALPSHDGYIMDQWTSRSINLLCDRQVVRMANRSVRPDNTEDNYEDFCKAVEALVPHFRARGQEVDAEWVEACLFAGRSRKPPLPWRQYVCESR